MDVKDNHEKLLIIVALVLCAGILFYNAFFIPDISIPSVIYVDSNNNTSTNLTQNIEEFTNIDSGTTKNTQNAKENSDATTDKAKSESKAVSGSKKININSATESELAENLKGVGTVIAKRIVEYREKVGKFKSIEEIKNVSGIGDKTFEKFKDVIYV